MGKKRPSVVVVPQGPSEYQLRSDTLVRVCVTLALVAGSLAFVRASFGVINTIEGWHRYPASEWWDELAEFLAAVALLGGAITARVGLRGHVQRLRTGLALVGFGGIAAYVVRILATFMKVPSPPGLVNQLDFAAFAICQSLESVLIGVLALVARRRVGRRHPDDE